MDISVVIPTYNRREMLLRSLATLFAQDASPLSYELIVVVDGSTDSTADALRTLKPPCRFRVIEQDNRGPAVARNAGYLAAETGLVLFLDDDMLCDPGLVASHVAAHKAAGPIAGFGALFLSPDSPLTLAAECFNREIGAYHLQRRRAPGIPWNPRECVFSNSSLPRQLLIDLGGFDPAFRTREDLEFGSRLFATGVVPQYIDGAVAHQFYDKTAADLIRDAEAFAVADVRFARKHSRDQSLGEVSWHARDAQWKQGLRRLAAISPRFADLLLAPICSLGEAFMHVPAMRNIGVRALQVRRRIHWLHKVIELSKVSTKSASGAIS